MPETAPLDVQHAAALVDQLARTGAENVEVGWLNDDPPFRYWARARWKGHAVVSDEAPSAAIALDGLARQVVHGGLCTGCERPISYPQLRPGYCGRVLVQAAEGDAMVLRRLCDLIALAAGIDPENPDADR